MNIENTNLHNILSTLISNQASLYSKVSGNLNDIFYVETFDSEPSISGLYINHNGESRYWTGIEWEYISNEISDTIDANSTSGTVPTSKAVYDLINSRTSGSVSDSVITEINGKIENVSGDVKTISENLANYALKSELPYEIHYVNSFPSSPTISGLYISSEGQSKLWVNNSWIQTSKELIDEILDSNKSNTDIIPSVKAVYDFVTSSLNEFTPSTDTNVREVYYLTGTEFEASPAISGIYINSKGQSKFWNGTEYEDLSLGVSNEINESSTSGSVPTSKSVYDFVTTSLQNNTGSSVNEVFYIKSFNNYTPAVSGIYIDQNGQSKFYSGTEWEQISNEVVDSFNDSNIEAVKYYLPSVSAVYDYVNLKLENAGKDIFYLTGTVFEDAPTNIGLYINTDGQSRYWNGSEYEELSIMSIDNIDESNIDQISGTVPTSKAVYDYISERNFGLSKSWKTISTTSGSYAVVIGNGLQQKVTLTGNITLTPPVLNSTYYSLILQITKTSNQTVSINSTTVLDLSKVGTFQIKWFYDGTNTYRYEPIQVYID